LGEEQEASSDVASVLTKCLRSKCGSTRYSFAIFRLAVVSAPSSGSRICNRPLEVSMIRGIATAAICIGALAALDHQLYYGQYTDKVLQMLGQMRHSFGI
jgi:hypothetical protein